MLTGLGDEEWMTKSYQDNRNKIRKDRTKYDSTDYSRYDCTSIDIGGGDSDDSSYEIKQYPYPITKTKYVIDIRTNDSRIGD